MVIKSDLLQGFHGMKNRAVQAGIGERIVLGGSSRLSGPVQDASGKMLSLATLLLGGVLVVAFLAWWTVRRVLS